MAVAVLVTEPDAPLATVPSMDIVTLPPAGNVGTKPDTVWPAIVTLAGHTAPPTGDPQLAESPVIAAGTTSLKLAPFALLGPALLITKL